ncbi:hypothetical protein OLS36_07075 [Campylobacter jejuni]|nr:hypothetical protein [Campylobacter jejuni]
MGKGIKIDFAKVNFHIKEFQKVYILENCKLCFYSPFHLQTQNGKEVKKIEKKGKSKIYLIDEDGKTVDIDKTSEQNKIKAREETRKKKKKVKMYYLAMMKREMMQSMLILVRRILIR